ncbi:neural cell adhesion molecule 1-like isoform X2 [Panulirus ornatus]|uniref:neural cell adhesion molecule 1-like isoform X2 n=1 Tax=Panulirus ornatus TaxID=150431 RepID=UPI003A8B1401
MVSLCTPPSLGPSSLWSCRQQPAILVWLLIVVWTQVVAARVVSKWPVQNVGGVAGTAAHLPCVAAHSRPADPPILVVWYKDGARRPFYILDLREGEGREEMVDPSLRDRLRSDPSGSRLTLDPARGPDTGTYKCRVDFNDSPTLSAIVTLTIYVVPSRLVVLDANSHPVHGGVLRSLMEGDTLTLYCIASGGRPPPEVTWWKGTTLLSNRSVTVGQDGTLLASHEEGDDVVLTVGVGVGVRYVRTVLTIPALTRDFAHANITCRASNNNITEPLSTTLYLEVYTRPASVVINPPGEPLVEGRQTRLECVAAGAYPSAVITWEKTMAGRSNLLKATSLRLGEVTSSWLTLVPEAGDHGATLTCRAHNPNIPGQAATTSTVLQITFAPRVTLRLGYNLQTRPVTEGEDVFFECEVASNPPPLSINWFKDSVEVVHDRRSGVLVSGNNLVLQMVRRTSAGNYTCAATNTLATTASNIMVLDIKYLPVCVDGPQTVTVAEGQDVRLTCRVDAKPDDDLRFTWYFNNTLDTVEVERHRVQVRPGHSFLDYTPRSSRDYGSLACWATNTVGTQADPCQFTVIEAGPPEHVEDCELVNHTGGRLEVRCSPGSDGGLPQWFVGKVYDAATHSLLVTIKETVPRFQVGGLTPGRDYFITITAVNIKGTSEPQEIDAVRLKVAEKRMGEVTSRRVSPLVGVFLGLVGGFIGLLLLGVSLTLVRSYRCRCLRPEEGSGVGAVVGGVGLSSPTTKAGIATPLQRQQGDVHAGPDVLISANYRALPTTSTPRARVVNSYCGSDGDGGGSHGEGSGDDTQARSLSALWTNRMSSSV